MIQSSLSSLKRSFTRPSIVVKLVLLFIPIIIAPMTITTYSSMHITYREAEKELQMDSWSALEDAKKILLQYNKRAESIAKLVANSTELSHHAHPHEAEAFLEAKRDLFGTAIVEIFDNKKQVVARNYTGRADKERFYTNESDPIIERTLNLELQSDYFSYPKGLTIKSTAPIINVATLEVLGVVVITYPLDTIFIRDIKEQIRTDVTIQWSKYGDVVSTIQDDLGIRVTQSWDKLTSYYSSDEDNQSQAQNQEKIFECLYAVSYASIKNNLSQTVGVLATALNRATVEKGKQDTMRIILISSSLAFILAVILGILTARSFTKPIYRLLSATRVMAQGRLETRVNLKQKDEIGKLARHLTR